MSIFNYKWYLKNDYNIKGIEKHKLKVFGTFICGGGSTMGYKLAGYDHIGGVEIDKKIAAVYKKNHNPKYLYIDDIRNIVQSTSLPDELYNLDILDGSPPCSSFSISGNREKDWGKEKKFREGQSKQVLDDLFFHYIDLANKLKPKIIIAENVKGLLMGNAKKYLIEINKKFQNIGYIVQIFLLNSSTMGVPQRRERVFFICRKKEIKFIDLKLNFLEKPIYYKEIEDNCFENKISKCKLKYFDAVKPGKAFSTQHEKGSFFNTIKQHPFQIVNTIASGSNLTHYKDKRELSNNELILASSFPLDYDFCNIKPIYILGMSVPPLMMANIAHQIYLQWFKTI